jgi:hypothetical protein
VSRCVTEELVQFEVEVFLLFLASFRGYLKLFALQTNWCRQGSMIPSVSAADGGVYLLIVKYSYIRYLSTT